MLFETQRFLGTLDSVTRLALSSGWLLACVACSGSVEDPGGSASTAPVARDDFGATYARRYCESIASCCQRAGFAQDFDACVQTMQAEIDFGLAGYEGLRVTFDEEAARACVEGNAAVVAHCNLYWLSFNEEPEACDRVFLGQQNAGAPCSETVECVAGTECWDGVCTAPPQSPVVHGAEGQACQQTCEAGFCDDGSVPGDGPASAAPICFREDGLFCHAGTCRPLSGLGGPCAVRADCDGFYRCDEASYTCAPFAQEGEPCLSNFDCESYRCGGDADASVCSPIVLATENQCNGDD